MPSIRMLALDLAFANVGVAVVEIDLDTFEIRPERLELLSTKPNTNKTVRVSSDKLRRAREMGMAIRALEAECQIMAAEIPTGGKSANVASGFGIATGIVALHTIPLIPVTQQEVKKAVNMGATPTKAQIIAKMRGLWPDLNWVKVRGEKTDHNEHLADALAVVMAAIKTPAFEQMAVMARSMKAAE